MPIPRSTLNETRITLTTAPNPGAVAILQLCGPNVLDVLTRLTGTVDWPDGLVRFVKLADIDEGCAVFVGGEDFASLPSAPPPICPPLLRGESVMGVSPMTDHLHGPSALGWAQVMPHGGPRVVQKLIYYLVECGCVYCDDVSARELYPEASTEIEADMLSVLARAASPAAIDLVLAQPRLWRRALNKPLDGQSLLERSDWLDRLIDPPNVVVVGPANVGKSTLTNQLLGKQLSIVADLPGTTRDWVAGLVQLMPLAGANVSDNDAKQSEFGLLDTRRSVAVRWLDTPGLRESDDPIEQRAIELAQRVASSAEILIAMRDPTTEWIPDADLPRPADIWVINKIDQSDDAGRSFDGTTPDEPLSISAKTGVGLKELGHRVLAGLKLADFDQHELWAFSPVLRRAVESNDWPMLGEYIGKA